MKEKCPLCNFYSPKFYRDKNFITYQCTNCFGIFKDQADRLAPKEEKLRYQLHQNNVDDLGYQKFVSPIVEAVLKQFSPSAQGLDFGAGTGPVIAKMLRDKGFSINLYDPFFYPNPKNLKQSYDFIVCCEVMEHFYHPNKEFEKLKELLLPNGKLFCMTELYDKNTDFETWYYKNDPTHVFLYTEKTLQFIAKKFNFKKCTIEGRLIQFFNG